MCAVHSSWQLYLIVYILTTVTSKQYYTTASQQLGLWSYYAIVQCCSRIIIYRHASTTCNITFKFEFKVTMTPCTRALNSVIVLATYPHDIQAILRDVTRNMHKSSSRYISIKRPPCMEKCGVMIKENKIR